MSIDLDKLEEIDDNQQEYLHELIVDAKFTMHFKAITAYAGDSHEKADRAKTVH